MKGDFSRWTFDEAKHYTRVLSLQGRVFLDADFNEAQELQLRHLRKLAADLLGPHAGPKDGFKIDPANPSDFWIKKGSYYVNGILCENSADDTKYSTQPYLPQPAELKPGFYYVYLDVWERFLTYVEDEDRSAAEIHQTIREVALGGPDTAARSKAVWQIRVLRLDAAPLVADNSEAGYTAFVQQLTTKGVVSNSVGKLKARARKPKADDQPCAIDPESRYRGPENQLYRVEIHTGGNSAVVEDEPTFKWSRENGSVIFPIRSREGATVIVDTLGRDDRLGLKRGDLVEVVDDKYVLQNRAEPLLTVKSVDPETFVVELSASPSSDVGTKRELHPILRRWEGTARVTVDPDPDVFLHLEDGIEISFPGGDYRTGDYWIIPARTATGDVEWPGPADDPNAVTPHGILHSYAPLAVIDVVAGVVSVSSTMRRTIKQAWV